MSHLTWVLWMKVGSSARVVHTLKTLRHHHSSITYEHNGEQIWAWTESLLKTHVLHLETWEQRRKIPHGEEKHVAKLTIDWWQVTQEAGVATKMSKCSWKDRKQLSYLLWDGGVLNVQAEKCYSVCRTFKEVSDQNYCINIKAVSILMQPQYAQWTGNDSEAKEAIWPETL